MAVIDADGHVIEPLAMFEDIPREFHPRRPIPVFMPTDTHRGDFNGCWIIEGKTFPNIGGKGNTIFFIPEDARSKARDVTLASQTLSDTGARLADLDRFNIDIQIIFPTMFLASAAEDVKLEAALFQAYNTYLSRACAQSKGRIRWAAPIPFRDVKAAVEEIHRARELGAAGVFSMGMVWDRSLDDPAFFPVFEAAADLDMPICLHLGWASPKVTSLFSDGQSFFSSATVPVMWGFMSTMGAGLLKRYPNLRIGFLETGSAWVPYAIQQIRRRAKPRSVTRPGGSRPSVSSGIDPDYYSDPEQYFRNGRAFVNCEGDEDFRYLIDHLGEDALMCSSDFPHGDASAEETFVTNWKKRTDLPDRFKDKVLGENAARFFRL